MLTVQHSVKLRSNGRKNSSMSKTTFVGTSAGESSGTCTAEAKIQPLNRGFSLLGAALSMMSEIFGISCDNKKVECLKYHSKSIKVCYYLVILLEQMIMI